MKIAETITAYYQAPDVLARIAEFLGGEPSGRAATCSYIIAESSEDLHRQPRPAADLTSCLGQGLGISRSLWDRHSLIAHLDIEYVNFDHPALAYLEPERTFDLQEPVERAVRGLLDACAVSPLHILSGRGHHFVWSIQKHSPAFRRLAEIGGPCKVSDGSRLPAEDGAAFAGLALVMELLAHLIKEEASPRCAVPVELTAVEVGPSDRGREMISVDISEYGDPLESRSIRVPFGAYLKPWQQRGLLGDEVVEGLRPLLFIPLSTIGTRDGVALMRDFEKAAALAGRVSNRIPDQTAGMEHLIRRYEESPMAEFHEWFYSQEHEPADRWPGTYDRTPLEALPSCARTVLSCPNDLLLRPSGMRLVTRTMLALGWHPRHIAGLIRSKFERDYGWGDQWAGYDPAMRADFYTRVFTGLFVLKRDDLVDFNCQSSKEEGTCLVSDCPNNLTLFRKSALARRAYDYLAHRPFNRLFLPDEHL